MLVRIDELPEVTTPEDADQLVISRGGFSKRIAAAALARAGASPAGRTVVKGSRTAILSQIDAVGENAKWTAALALKAAGAIDKILIDGNIYPATPLDVVGAAHAGLIIEGAGRFTRIEAAAPLGATAALLDIAAAATGVTVRSLRFSAAGNAGYGLHAMGDDFIGEFIESHGASNLDPVYAISLSGGNPYLRHFYVHDAAQGLHVLARAATPIRNVRAFDGRYYDIKVRALNVTGATGKSTISGIWAARHHFEAMPWDCQPARFDGMSSPVAHVVVGDFKVEPAFDGTKADDSVSFHAVDRAYVGTSNIHRYTDVGINFSNGCTRCRAEDNQVFAARWGISAGVSTDRANGTPNADISIVGNRIDSWVESAVAVFDTDRALVTGNSGRALGGKYDLQHEDSTRIAWLGNAFNDATTSRFYRDPGQPDSTFDRIDGALPAVPAMASGAPAGSVLHDTGAGKTKIWIGAAWAEISTAADLAAVVATMPVRKVKAADTVRTSTVSRTADPDLQIALEANKTYLLDLTLLYSSTSVANLSVAWAAPAGATVIYWVDNWNYDGQPTAAGTTPASPTGTGASAVRAFRERAMVTMGATAGTVSVNWAQATSEATYTTVRAGSRLTAEKLSA